LPEKFTYRNIEDEDAAQAADFVIAALLERCRLYCFEVCKRFMRNEQISG
jgi:hypothetical protein